MALVLADRVRETTTTVGTGTVTLGGAVVGYQSFSVVGNGNTTYYCIAAQGVSEWEVGLGTYSSSGSTLARTTVLSSSNGGSAVNFSAGTKDVFVTYPSERSVYSDGTNIIPDNAATLLAISGGTGQSSYVVGDILYASTTTALSKLADVATGNAIISGGVGVAPSYGKIGLTTHVSGVLPAANGGTGQSSSFTANGVVYASSTSALATGSALTFNGTNLTTTGSATATAFIPSSSTVPTNGLYLPAANSVGISTNSIERLQISSTGQFTFTVDDMTSASPSAYNFRSTGKAAQTGTYTGLISTVNTDATYTGAGSVIGVYANQGTMTVAPTNAYGFYISSGWVDATNNYGYYSNIAAATGRWNFYANNTADNYFAGNVGIGINLPAVKLHVVGGATSGAVDDAAIFSGGVAGVSGSGAAIYLTGGGGVSRGVEIAGVNTGGANGAHAMVFSTSASSASPTERMRITSTGLVNIPGLTASKVIFTDASDNLTSTGTVGVDQGGTGQTTYTNGQLLIGNTTGNTLTKATLTAGTGITVTNGAGSITIAATAGAPSVQTFDASGTWTKPGSGDFVRIQMWGGGGGGSRVTTVNSSNAGGGGGYFELTVPIASMGATAAVTVGAAGVGRISSTGVGTAGGNSGVTLGSGSTVYVSGGAGGVVSGGGGAGGWGALVFNTTALRDTTQSPSGSGGSVGSGGGTCEAAQDGFSYTGGGGGGGSFTAGAKGGWGGGGGTRGTGAGGTSIFGGAGGNSAGAGVQPGGGGGSSASANTNATNGALGRVIITTY
jgi:hypothetical protein